MARKATRREWGKVRTLPSGRRQASYLGPDGLRYNAAMTYDNETDARAWLASVRSEIARGVWVSPAERAEQKALGDRTLADYATAWLSERTNSRGDHLRPRTLAEYRRLLDGPLADLGASRLGSITPAKVRTWRAAQLATGRKTQTSRAYGLLNAIMVTAEGDRLIESNPCTIKGGQATHTGRKVVPPTDAELDAILSAMPEEWRALVWLAAGGGLRWGEATELRRKDVTVERDDGGAVVRALVKVERAVTVSSELPDALPHGAHRCDCRRGCLVGEPKSAAGMRSLYIYGDAAEVVADHLARHALRFGNPLLFPALGDDSGQRHLSQSTFHTPAWSAAREVAGRADMPFHALRHYSATAYSQAGATPAENNRRHGWSSVTVGMRYQHAGNRDEELAARMARRTTSA